ncbi:RDD family protein [Cocleimonas flava]|uniref:Putative RDD family membrane protein YckC n=1 Tax=Cocleimonas flava TaxID=634765 RepID=A0A4R1F282_9GAMM|nr:RDD family protein [Cocleimonas flava]TCJ84441.1 putative RDD family membrane protein YckC [Cocleimonas flava]
MTLDTLYQVNTPEGISLRLSPAGPVVRMLAWTIDILIRLGINAVFFTALAFFGKTGLGIALILSFLLEWFYPVYFELYKKGQTPGKKMFNLYVSMEDASPISPGASIIRNLLRFVDFLPFLYGFGFISMLLTKRFQRLGDLVAGTVVLHKSLNYPTIEEDKTKAISPPVALNLNEQQALIRFQQRIPYLTAERAEELAQIATPLLLKNSNENSIENKQASSRLLGIANWIMGAKH